MRNTTSEKRLLDAVDEKIVDEFQRSGRISNREIARRLGLSEAAVRKRVGRMEAEGLLQFYAAVDPARMGLQYSVSIRFQVDLTHIRRVAAALAELEEITYLAYTSGAHDLIAVAVFRSQAGLFQLIADKLAGIEGIQRIETSHVLETVKRTFAWGLPSPNGATPSE